MSVNLNANTIGSNKGSLLPSQNMVQRILGSGFSGTKVLDSTGSESIIGSVNGFNFSAQSNAYIETNINPTVVGSFECDFVYDSSNTGITILLGCQANASNIVYLGTQTSKLRAACNTTAIYGTTTLVSGAKYTARLEWTTNTVNLYLKYYGSESFNKEATQSITNTIPVNTTIWIGCLHYNTPQYSIKHKISNVKINDTYLYKLGEQSGNIAYDSSSQAKHGTIYNATPALFASNIRPIQQGRCYKSDGTGSISIANLQNTLFPQSEFTIVIRFKYGGNDSGGKPLFGGYYDSTVKKIDIQHDSSSPQLFLFSGSGTAHQVGEGAVMVVGNIYTLTVTCKTGTGAFVKFYRDGVLRNQKLDLDTTWLPSQQMAALLVGNAYDTLYEFMVFKRVLTDTEIANFQTGTTPVDPYCWLTCDEGSGNIAIDRSGYGNHGWMTGTIPTVIHTIDNNALRSYQNEYGYSVSDGQNYFLTGQELQPEYDFNNNTGFYFGSGWSVVNGQAINDGSYSAGWSALNTVATNYAIANRTYRIEIKLSRLTQGIAQFRLGDGAGDISITPAVYNASQTKVFTFYRTPTTTGQLTCWAVPDLGLGGNPIIEYMSVKEVIPSGVLIPRCESVLGNDLVTNGNFSSWENGYPTWWTKSITSPATITQVENACRLYSPDGSFVAVNTGITLTAGKSYKIELDVVKATTGSIRLDQGGSSSLVTWSTTGHKIFYLKVTTTGVLSICRYSGATDIIFSNVVVKEVNPTELLALPKLNTVAYDINSNRKLLDCSGKVKFNADLVKSNCAYFDTTCYLAPPVGAINNHQFYFKFYINGAAQVDKFIYYEYQGSCQLRVRSDTSTGAKLGLIVRNVESVTLNNSNQFTYTTIFDGTDKLVEITGNNGIVKIYVNGVEDPYSITGQFNYTPSGTWATNVFRWCNQSFIGKVWGIKTNSYEYPCSEGNTSYLLDVSGNGNHGTLTGATLSTFWGQTQDNYHYNLKRGFRNVTYLDGTATSSKIYNFKLLQNSDYEIKFNFLVPNVATGIGYFVSQYAAGAEGRMTIGLSSTVNFFLGSSINGSITLSTPAIQSKTVYEYKLVKTGNNYEVFLNGVSVGTATSVTQIYQSANFALGYQAVGTAFNGIIWGLNIKVGGVTVLSDELNGVNEPSIVSSAISYYKIPAKLNSNLDVFNIPLNNPTTIGHNRAETLIKQPLCPTLIQNDINGTFFTQSNPTTYVQRELGSNNLIERCDNISSSTFESGVDGWAGWQVSSYASSSEKHHSGSKSLKIVCGDGFTQFCVSKAITLEVGCLYRWTVWFINGTCTGNNFLFQTQTYPSTVDYKDVYCTGSTTTWQKVIIYFTPTQAASQLKIYNNGCNAGEYFYVDDSSIEKITVTNNLSNKILLDDSRSNNKTNLVTYSTAQVDKTKSKLHLLSTIDNIPSAVLATGLNRISNNHSKCLRVRRSSDSLETDIGFIGNELDTATLLSFVGSGDGFISQWYDASLNKRPLSSTATSNQPKIVSNGNLVTVGTKIALLNDGVDDNLTNSNFAGLIFPQSEFTVIVKNAVASGVTDQGIFNSYSVTSSNPFIKYNGTLGVNYALGYNGGTYNSYSTSNNTIVANTTNVFAMAVKCGTGGSVRYYLNGTKIYDQTIANTSWTPANAVCSLNKAIGGALKYDMGLLVYSRQLTDSEVSTISNKL